jgi:quinol monooxygenase YgiN
MSDHSQSFIVIAGFQVKPDCMDAFLLAALDDAKHSISDEPGCRQFDVIKADDEENTIVFYEVYDSRAAFDAHLKTMHLARFRDAFPPMVVAEHPVRFGTRLG